MHLLWRALHCFKTCIKYLPVSRGKLDCDDKKKWWNNPVYLLWSCRCRSCPPCPRQTPSEGKTQSRPFPVPFLPKAQNSHVIWQKHRHHRESWWRLNYLTMTFRTQHLIGGPASLVRLLKLTRCLNSCLSSMVIVSAFAMMGTMLTEWLRRFMNSTSNWRRLGEEEEKPKVLAFLKMLRQCQMDLFHWLCCKKD